VVPDVHGGLQEYAERRLRRETLVLGNRDVAAASAQPDVGTGLTSLFEPQAAKRLDSISAADVARQFHTSVRTGSELSSAIAEICGCFLFQQAS
jgi:hypothetical protein